MSEPLSHLDALVFEHIVKNSDSNSKVVEVLFNEDRIPKDTPLYFKFMLKLFLNELENWIHDDANGLSMRYIKILEQCNEFAEEWEYDGFEYQHVLGVFIEQLLLCPLYSGNFDEYNDMVHELKHSEDEVFEKRRSIFLQACDRIQSIWNDVEEDVEELRMQFSKYEPFETIMEFLEPCLEEFIYKESRLSVSMDSYMSMKAQVAKEKEDSVKRRIERATHPSEPAAKKRRVDNGDDDNQIGSSDSDSSDSTIDALETKQVSPTIRRKRVFWTDKEEKYLRKGVKKYGVGNWSIIYQAYHEIFELHRRVPDLKDKWRNIMKKEQQLQPQ